MVVMKQGDAARAWKEASAVFTGRRKTGFRTYKLLRRCGWPPGPGVFIQANFNQAPNSAQTQQADLHLQKQKARFAACSTPAYMLQQLAEKNTRRVRNWREHPCTLSSL